MSPENIAILLIDDDEVDALNVVRAFSKVKIRNPLFRAHDGLEALAMLRGGSGLEKIEPTPKIILLDINMPRMNGIEFLREMRQDPQLKSINVVVLTTSNEDQDKIEAYRLNVAGYVIKPLVPGKFIEAVSTLNMYWNLIEMP